MSKVRLTFGGSPQTWNPGRSSHQDRSVVVDMGNLSFNGVPMSGVTGPLFWAFMLSYLLYGIMIAQIYVYSNHYSKDVLITKITVILLITLELVFLIMQTEIAYRSLGSGWGNFDVIVYLDWAWKWSNPVNGLLAFVAQTYYIWRIWNLTKIFWVVLINQLLAILSLIAIVYCCVKYLSIQRFDQIIQQNKMIIVWLASSSICDCLITISLVGYLLHAKSHKTILHSTSSLLSKLTLYTIETGMITSLTAVLVLIPWFLEHQQEWYYVPYFCLGRLYTNALLATLNRRKRLSKPNKSSPTSSNDPVPDVDEITIPTLLWSVPEFAPHEPIVDGDLVSGNRKLSAIREDEKTNDDADEKEGSSSSKSGLVPNPSDQAGSGHYSGSTME